MPLAATPASCELQNALAHFSGTELYHRWSPLFRRVVLTDGAQYLAEKAGAFWLMDAIASHQPEALKNARLVDFQLWTLTVNEDRSAVLECFADSGMPPAIVQKIEFTDFPLESISLYCNPLDETHRVILLRTEY